MKLKGFMQSGKIFIGDPSYLSGPADYQVVAPENLDGRALTQAGVVDVTPEDPYNPFRKWDSAQQELGENDVNLKFYNTKDEGRGVVIQADRLNGRFEVEKVTCPTTGRLLEIKIKLHD